MFLPNIETLGILIDMVIYNVNGSDNRQLNNAINTGHYVISIDCMIPYVNDRFGSLDGMNICTKYNKRIFGSFIMST